MTGFSLSFDGYAEMATRKEEAVIGVKARTDRETRPEGGDLSAAAVTFIGNGKRDPDRIETVVVGRMVGKWCIYGDDDTPDDVLPLPNEKPTLLYYRFSRSAKTEHQADCPA